MASEQKAIADALNISVATVSRSLRNHPAISAPTRARVVEAAVRLGYRNTTPSKLAKPMDGKRASGMVHLGVLCRGTLSPGSVHSTVALRLIQGMSAAARANRATLHIEYLSSAEFDRLDDPAHWPAVIQEHVVSGLAVFADLAPAALAALSAHLPCVQFVSPAPDVTADCVTEDNVRSIGQLVNHLAQLGHTRIGLADFGYESPSARARFAGYVQALADRGIDYDPTLARFLSGDTSAGSERAVKVAEHVRREVDRGVRAWICLDDYLGYLLIAALGAKGLRVPEDVSVCGFDNFDPPQGMPKLTSIDGPFETMGGAAVKQLLGRVVDRGGEPPVHIMYGCRLVLGQSSGRLDP